MDENAATPRARQGALDIVIDAFGDGWRRMTWILFQGPHATPANWAWWGLILLLAGAAGGGGGGNGGSRFSGDDIGGHSLGAGGLDHWPAWAMPAIVGGVCCVMLIVIVFLYIRSRFRLILVDGVLSGEPRIRDVWSRTAGPGLQYFVWELIVNLSLLVLLIPVLLTWLPVIRDAFRGIEPSGGELFAKIMGTIVYVIPLIILKALIDWFVYDLALPQVWLRGQGFLVGLKAALAAARDNVLVTLTFLVGRFVVGIAGVMAHCLIMVCACILWIWPAGLIFLLVMMSIGAPPLVVISAPLIILLIFVIAWLVSTLTAPIYVFYRAWSIAFVGRLEPGLGGEGPGPAAPWTSSGPGAPGQPWSPAPPEVGTESGLGGAGPAPPGESGWDR